MANSPTKLYNRILKGSMITEHLHTGSPINRTKFAYDWDGQQTRSTRWKFGIVAEYGTQ